MTYPVEQQTLSGWANYPVVQAEVATPPDREAVRDYVLKQERLIRPSNAVCHCLPMSPMSYAHP